MGWDEKKAVVLGFSLPLIFIAIIGLLVNVQNQSVQPTSNFLFSLGPTYASPFYYTMANGKFEKIETKSPNNAYGQARGFPRLFVYDVKTNKASELTFEEAQKFNLYQKLESPDGYVVSGDRSNGSGGFLLYSHSSYGIYIQKGSARKKIDLPGVDNDSYYNNSQFTFLAWIKE